MKNPKGDYNDDALNDLLKQYMLDEAVGDRAANEWLETEAEAVFASEPEHVPAKEKETALIAALNEQLATGSSKGGGLIWKGSALGILLVGVITATIILWPEAQAPVVSNESIWTDEGYQNDHFPYYDGSSYLLNDTNQQPDKSLVASKTPDNTPIERLVVRTDDPAIVPEPDTLVAVATKPTPKPKNGTKTLLRELRRRLETFNKQFPAERVYAHIDRTDYLPGQTLWFSAYLLNESNLKASTQSDIIKTEILSATGEPVALKEWIVTNGRIAGDLPIPQGLASGAYIFRAYTAWQENMPGSKIFEAPIIIQQPGQTLLMDGSIAMKQPNIEFFPEGGDLVVGLKSRVAFTISSFQGPVNVTISDANGTEVASFTPNAEGQGMFTFTPQADMVYFATINQSAIQVPLPQVYPDGYVMEVTGQQGNWVKANIKSTKEANVVLVGQLRGEMYYGTEMELQPGDNLVNIPANNMPAGVLHLSLFDAEGVGHAERLVFVNKHKQLHVSIATDKANYLPREKVTAQIVVTDDKGRPVQTTLSVSAADDLLTHTQNTNILSALLLEPDLGSAAHHAGYLFNPANKNADKELDLLLMTSGWRRFTWKEVYYGLRQPVAIAPESAVLKGKVIDENGKPLKDVKITNKLLGIKTATAADGSFHIPNLDLSQLRELDFTYKVGIMTVVINRYQNDLVVEFKGDARKVYQPLDNSRQHPALTGMQKNAKGAAIAGQVLNAYGNGIPNASITVTAADGTVQRLQTDAKGYYIAATEKAGNYKVTVEAAGYNVYQNPTVKTAANQFSMLYVLLTYQVDMGTLPAHFDAHQADTIANRYAFLAGKFDPAYTSPADESGKNPLLTDVRGPLRDGVTAYYVEGLKMRYNEPVMLPLSAIGHIERFDHGLPSKYNDANGTVIEVTTGVSGTLSGTPKAPEDRPMGFQVRYAQPREYPKTNYTVRDKGDSRTDLRSTLYWNGNITTDNSGKATIEFYASDDLSAFRLIVEGLGNNGLPGRTEQVVGMAWPFDLRVQMPEVLKKGEKILVPIWVENYTGKQVNGSFDFTLPAGLKPIWPLAPKEYALFPQRSDSIKVQLEVIDPMAVGTLTIGYTANGYRDVFTYVLPPMGRKED